MKTVAYIAASLDGYIADKEGGVDWLNEIPNPEQDDYGFAEFMQKIDAVLMGANTFRVVQSFGVWPYTVPVFVASGSIRQVPAGYEGKIELVKGNILEILSAIAASGNEKVYVDGGKLIQSCLKENALDELIITHIPILLGSGIPLFGELERRIELDHVQTQVLGIGLVKSHYRIRK